ncbi:DUF3726 domain-containing protein [Paracoccus salsus]|uniref:DUF3726 domain-containing protein n=1 Tax=Paracoccus salsus TaxID=2911061 RepID=UPI001F272BBF|nr:DUF3726 domain-containing protein [Paracoccus salsus]MCF3972115.1 DUF3726 domain-containing protein [Paracoccus salsus]
MSAAQDHEAEPNDPTRSGSPVPGGKDACLSQNEIEQLCLKAARGAGMSWGLAEEAGFAAAWLAARGLDGPGILLAQLTLADGRPWDEICPLVAPGRFAAEDSGCLCPIALGSTLCDHAALPQASMENAPLRLGPVSCPLLLLPFLSAVATARRQSLCLRWPRGMVVLTADGQIAGDATRLGAETSLTAELERHKPATERVPVTGDLPFLPSETLRGLNDLALRTTVPASEASRAGAGAVTGDND